jgi:hypothetical protein
VSQWQVKWDWADGLQDIDHGWFINKAWPAGAFDYKRCGGGTLWLTEEQNARLIGVETNARSARALVSERLAANAIGKPWDNKIVTAVLEEVRQIMVDHGFGASSEFIAADRLAVRTAQQCRDRHKRVLPPKKFAGAPTFRIFAGAFYDLPLQISRQENALDGVVLGDLGLAYSSKRLDDTWTGCAYFELQRMAGNWAMRGVWVTKRASKKNARVVVEPAP